MKLNLFTVFRIVSIFFAGSILHGCGNSSNSAVAPDPDTIPVPDVVASRPNMVKVYIDASGSMRDYFGDIDISTISNALTSLEQVPDGFKAKYYCWGNPPEEIERNNLTKKLLGKKLNGMSTVYAKIVGPMAAQSTKDTLAVLITDGIISSKSSDTEKCQNFTDFDKGHQITDIQKALTGKGKAISVYRMIGAFDGYYYDKGNNKVKYTGDRPFFVLVMGQPENVRFFDDEVRKGNVHDVYKNAEAIYIGTAPQNMEFRIEPKSIDSSDDDDDENDDQSDIFDRIENTRYKYTGLGAFRITATIPQWVKDSYSVETIRAMSQVKINNEIIKNIKLNIEGDIIAFDIPEKEVVQKFKNSDRPYTIEYTMTDPSAGAWDHYSTGQDSSPDNFHTYLLADLVGALRKGIIGNNTNLLQSSITIIP